MRVSYLKTGIFCLWLFVKIGNWLFQAVVNADLVCASISAWPFKKKYQINCVVLLLDRNSKILRNSQFPGNSTAQLTVQVPLCCLNLQLGLPRCWWRWNGCVKRLRKVNLHICACWLISYRWIHYGWCIYKVLKTVSDFSNWLTFLWTILAPYYSEQNV